MNRTKQLSENDFADANGADSLFDDEATVLAQPVVPLAASADAPEEMTVVAGAPPAAHASDVFSAARRPGVLALVLVSALFGAVIGGAALYLFQRGRTAPAPAQPSAAAAQTTTAPAEGPQPAQNAQQPQPPAPQDSQAPPAAETRPDAAQEQPAELAPRPAADDAAPRLGKKGEGEQNAPAEHAAERPRSSGGVIDTQAPIPDDSSPASIRASRVEEALRRVDNNRTARRARRVGTIH